MMLHLKSEREETACTAININTIKIARRNWEALEAETTLREEEEHEREAIDVELVVVVANRIARFVVVELREGCVDPCNRQTVMEHLLASPLLYPHLSSYYMKPETKRGSHNL